MDLLITIFTVVLALVLFLAKLCSSQDGNRSKGLSPRREEPPFVQDNPYLRPQPQPRPDILGQYGNGHVGARPVRGIDLRAAADVPQLNVENREQKVVIDRWRRSIVGLVKMADRNLQAASYFLSFKNYIEAVKAASTGVENASRALIHCYGGKPDTEPGQEEPLRILALKFSGLERERFGKVVDEIAAIRSQIAGQEIIDTEAQSVVQSAARIVVLFKQMIKQNFVAEIPELKDACPKCVTIDVSTWYFNQTIAIQQCNICRYKWVAPRAANLDS